MFFDINLPYIAALLLACFPISLFGINYFSVIFFKHSSRLRKTSVILTGLNGILTKNVLAVKVLMFDNYRIKPDIGNNLLELDNLDSKQHSVIQKPHLQKEESCHLAAIAGSLVSYQKIKHMEEVIGKFFLECGINKMKIKSEYEVIQEIPTNEVKKISTVVAIKKNSQEIFAFSKGNPYRLLEKCTRTLVNGKKIEINKTIRFKIKNKIKKLNKEGNKIIAFAYKGLPLKRLETYTDHFAENDLIFLGMIGLSTPINHEAAKLIEAAKELGIKTYIFTAEKELKAVSAASQLELINQNYFEAINGSFLDQMPDQKLKKNLANKEKDLVFAELNETNKTRILDIFKELGDTVAVVNKDIRNLENIIQRIKKSRQYSANYHKFAYHALSCKIAEFILILSAIIFKAPNPLPIALILIIDIFINFVLELALKSDNLKEEAKLPIGRLLINGLCLGIVLSGIYVFSLAKFGWTVFSPPIQNPEVVSKAVTTVFFLIVVSQILSAFSARHSKKSILGLIFSANSYLLLTSIISILIIDLLIAFFAVPLGLSALSLTEWEIILFSMLIILLIEETRKLILRKNESLHTEK